MLLFAGASLALAADRIGTGWLFYVGLAMLLAALTLPTAPGQSLRDRVRNLVAHMPGARMFLGRDDDG